MKATGLTTNFRICLNRRHAFALITLITGLCLQGSTHAQMSQDPGSAPGASALTTPPHSVGVGSGDQSPPASCDPVGAVCGQNTVCCSGVCEPNGTCGVGIPECPPDELNIDFSGWSVEDQAVWTAARAQFVTRYGCHSLDYLSNWATLKTGKAQRPKLDWSALTPRVVTYDTHPNGSPHHYASAGLGNPDFLHLSDIESYVTWHDTEPVTDPPTVPTPTLITVDEVSYVLIENLRIMQMNSDYIAKHTLHITNCDTVILRNCYFAGPVSHSHIRIAGCRQVFIDNVEIEGVVYGDAPPDETRNGQGIYIDNCNSKARDCEGAPDPISCDEDCEDVDEVCESDTNTHDYYVCTPDVNYVCCENNLYDLDWLVIQNTHIHDYGQDDCPEKEALGLSCSGNQDGISISSPSDGIVFNNVVENWDSLGTAKRADAAFDIDHRRFCDADYQDKHFRIERNMLLNNLIVKTPGLSDASNRLLIANNIFLNNRFIDYHKAHDNYVVHNTFVYDGAYVPEGHAGGLGFYKQVDFFDAGTTQLGNNLVFVADDTGFDHMYWNRGAIISVDGVELYTEDGQMGDLEQMVMPDHNVYAWSGDISLANWMHEYVKVRDYDTLSCEQISEMTILDQETEFADWQTVRMKDTHSAAESFAACFADPEFNGLAPATFSPTGCPNLVGQGSVDYLDLGPEAFRITRDFFGHSRAAEFPAVGAIQPGPSQPDGNGP